ncbi:hypothetical protein PR202_ga28883 [Eleusine coracana subsp. coracana]|uniref:F-box domain-containing protein n=1 Tax=Eleusine coracana subsp. coracana TaxID=191504 RepID=A0AAV5DKS5_ELECO|nr:hypothetical protein QOZ80_7AG0580700 [Eleusine coracana subsp. coracana]GJN10761.1 hypothetical protein PR202_ga28883 [Eleusine coracana subsp. coracana]
MENPSKKSKTQATHRQGDEPVAAHVHLPEEIITEIVTCLPGKSVLCFLAVSRAWHRITTDPEFLAAHARRRPLEVILRTLVKSVRPRDDWVRYNTDDIALATVMVSGDAVGPGPGPNPARRLVQYPYSINRIAPASPQGMMIDSCDGVLLFKIGRCTYVIFNPVTWQWAELPRLPEIDTRASSPPWTTKFGFYRH